MVHTVCGAQVSGDDEAEAVLRCAGMAPGVRNRMVRMLTGVYHSHAHHHHHHHHHHHDEPTIASAPCCNASDLESAKASLRASDWFGVLECEQQSTILLHRLLQTHGALADGGEPVAPALELPRLNVRGAGHKPSMLPVSPRTRFGAAVMRRIAELNDLDMQLYEYARALLDERLHVANGAAGGADSSSGGRRRWCGPHERQQGG